MTIGSDILWTSTEAAKVTGGRNHAEAKWHANSISIDTRTLKKGALFVALKGDNGDGHDYVAQALKKGAAAALVSHVPEGVALDAPLLIVGDTLTGLQDLAMAARAQCGGKMIAITGSVGKTGTKEMMAAALAAQGQTHASPASYNNHWGVPFTLASMHRGTDYGVFEIGMNHGGEITPLSKMVRPDIVMITTVAPVHIESFENEQGIADAKGEIFDGLVDGGKAILNHDNQWFDYLKNKLKDRDVTLYSFGAHEDADARLVKFLPASNGCRVNAEILDEDVAFTLQHSGKHIALNAIATLLAIKLAGGDIKIAARELGVKMLILVTRTTL